MDTVAVVALVVGAVVIVVLGVLLGRAHAKGANVEAGISVADLFSLNVKLTAAEVAQASTAVAAAATERSGQAAAAREIARTQTTARILWVDDNPDNNVRETIALERLGKFIVKATSTDAALLYLDELDVAVVITDLHRGEDPDAGRELARLVGDRVPVIVYTANAWAAGEVDGAVAVLDLPWDLLDVIQRVVG
ncbi:response regulator [Actinokineospora cianjurensis]|uniref:Response regulatory domain-containing protein n=1 Tax=Actinokineospora cianjurensis TaxID=585224 RepID=A0A421B9T6_9PSEU|nr:response regulator [Actinokineospora cianjurensis]RLK61087.1 hypothetical protein CLV68_1602 [Actinokineospora cianjurensis]